MVDFLNIKPDYDDAWVKSVIGKAQQKKTTDIFSPTNFTEYIGQEKAKEILKITINAAKKENRSLPNILIVGGFGLGKTSLAKILFMELGLAPKIVDGNSVNTTLPTGTVIIDEIHNVLSPNLDSLNLLLDQEKVHIVGCTTNPGELTAAFRSRFRIIELTNYTVENLVTIAENICKRKKVTANKTILYKIAERSRFNARTITNLMGTIFDIAVNNNNSSITESNIQRAFDLLEIDEKGFLERDRRYVACLPDRPVGIGFISAVLGVDKTTIEEEIEPYLLQQGIIDRTPRGRIKIKDIK